MNRIMLAFAGAAALLALIGAIVGSSPTTAPKRAPTEPASRPPAPSIGDAVAARDPAAGTDTASAVGGSAARTPRELAQAFAAQQANWSYKTIARQYRRLASLATGALRTQLSEASQDARADQTLRRDKAGSHGRVLGIDIQGTGDRRRIVAATIEAAYSDGNADLQGQRARVYVGRAERNRTGWVMTAWAPQP